MPTYIVGGIAGPSELGLWHLADALRQLGVPDVSDPFPAYAHHVKVINAGLVGYRGLRAAHDGDAQRLADQIDTSARSSVRRQPLVVIALSGGATVAFNAADLLARRDKVVDHLVTIGGVALRRRPIVREWTRIVSSLDPLSALAPVGATRTLWVRHCLHRHYLRHRLPDTLACLDEAGIIPPPAPA